MRRRTLIGLSMLGGSLLLLMFLLPLMVIPARAQTIVPTITPTLGAGVPTFTPIPVGCEPALNSTVGSYAYIRPGVSVRHIPSVSGAQVWYNDKELWWLVTLTEGPICADGYIWWKVIGAGNPGWVAEGKEGTGILLFPAEGLDPGCTSTIEFGVGQRVELSANVRVRDVAGTQGRTLTIAPAGTLVDVLGGPECVENRYWWQVRAIVLDFPYEGWMAQTFEGVTLLLPENRPSLEEGTLCANPLSLGVGVRAFVQYRDHTPKYLRTAPGTDSQPLYSLVNNVPFIVEGGPVCRENMNWWKIRVLASREVIGWMSEGSPGVGYWMRAINPFEFATYGD